MLHGHAHPAVVRAVSDRVSRGTDFGSSTELHVEMARALRERVRSVERVRFANSGTEALLYAIRAARAFTGRPKILKFEGSYHGGYDSVVVSVNPGTGAPPFPQGLAGSPGMPAGTEADTLVAPFNDLATAEDIIRRNRDELAVVLVEPVMVRGMIPADLEFLTGLREVTRKTNVLLLVDEVVTFRLSPGGAQEIFGLVGQPDLTTFGKVIGGGLPVGAFGGRADIMAVFDPAASKPVHHSGTFAGNAVTLAAGLATLNAYTVEEAHRINRLGDRLRQGLESVIARRRLGVHVTGMGSLVGLHFTSGPVRDYRSALAADRDLALTMHLALLNRGIFARPAGGFFLSTAMGEREIDRTIQAFSEALDEVPGTA
jgi:glutamate-1-semialdehyde 2,1-aminomutase